MSNRSISSHPGRKIRMPGRTQDVATLGTVAPWHLGTVALYGTAVLLYPKNNLVEVRLPMTDLELYELK